MNSRRGVPSRTKFNSAGTGDAKTLVILPFVTVQAQLTEDERISSGVTPGLIRVRSHREPNHD